jgi:hypothetical protein
VRARCHGAGSISRGRTVASHEEATVNLEIKGLAYNKTGRDSLSVRCSLEVKQTYQYVLDISFRHNTRFHAAG